MRTLILLCLVAVVVGVGMAFAVGLVSVATDHSDGKFVMNVTVNTDMIHSRAHDAETNSPGSTSPDATEMKGTITSVRPEANEFVMSENVKNWNFQLAKDGKVFINDRESNLAELQAGDEAMVTFDRQGQKMLATAVQCTRK